RGHPGPGDTQAPGRDFTRGRDTREHDSAQEVSPASFQPGRGRESGAAGQRAERISLTSSAACEGVLPTFTATASRASFFACAVPEEPDTIAPAWPMVLPSGAVNPAT